LEIAHEKRIGCSRQAREDGRQQIHGYANRLCNSSIYRQLICSCRQAFA